MVNKIGSRVEQPSLWGRVGVDRKMMLRDWKPPSQQYSKGHILPNPDSGWDKEEGKKP